MSARIGDLGTLFCPLSPTRRNANRPRLLLGMYVPVRWEAVPSAGNPGVSHAAEKLRAIAECAPEIENDLRQMADDLDARMRQPTAYRERPARAAARQRLTRLLPVLKFGRLHRFWR